MDEYQIVELVKDRHRAGSIKADYNILLNDTTIISDISYEHLYQYNPYISKRVIGYVYDYTTIFVSNLEFPILQWDSISSPYLYKKGYVVTGDSSLGPAPLPNLKYIIYSIASITGIRAHYFQDRLVIELVDLDVVANNLNLPKIVSSVLGPKLLTKNNMIQDDEVHEIEKQMRRQKLFAGHTWKNANRIVYQYYDGNDRKLSKEVFKISESYQRVFRPYRVVYNTKTWEQVLM